MSDEPKKPLTPANYTLRTGYAGQFEIVDLWHGEARVTISGDGAGTTWLDHAQMVRLRDFLNDVIVSNLWRYPSLGSTTE